MSPPLPNPISVTSPKIAAPEFSPQERACLLAVAHDSILSTLQLRELSFDPSTPHLSEIRGVFTSLHLAGQLRGCIGYVISKFPLYRTVAETARGAAFADNRFSPVTLEEAAQLAIELSILSPPELITPEEIEVGRHGLLISHQGLRGLLLPQVAAERQWDRLTFLSQTCRKAGLPSDAWQNGAVLQAFTAEVFGERITDPPAAN
jgi:AmmeMemoRadiSam system protein A